MWGKFSENEASGTFFPASSGSAFVAVYLRAGTIFVEIIAIMVMTLLDKFNTHRILTQAAALAFYTTLSLGPLLMIFFLLLSLTQWDIQMQFLTQVQGLFGSSTADLVGTMVATFEKNAPSFNSFAGIFAIVTLLISSSAVFAQLRESLDVIISKNDLCVHHFSAAEEAAIEKNSHVETIKSFILGRLFSIGMVLTFIFLLATSLVLSSFLSALVRVEESSVFYLIMNGLISLLLFSGIFFLVFIYMPQHRAHVKPVMIGALTTGLLFVLGKELLGQLASSTLMASSYGAGGSLVVLMAWFYYAAMILFLGAEIVAFYDQKAT